MRCFTSRSKTPLCLVSRRELASSARRRSRDTRDTRAAAVATAAASRLLLPLLAGGALLCAAAAGSAGCSGHRTPPEGRSAAKVPAEGAGASATAVAGRGQSESESESATLIRGPRVAAGSSAAASGSGKTPGPSIAADYHPVFSLEANRLLAHAVRRGGLFIPAGHPGFAKYLNFGRPWSTFAINETFEGRKVALANRSVSWIRFPLTAEQARATTLSLRLFSPAVQGLRIQLNSTRVETARLGPGWQTAYVAVPPGTLRTGENRVELSWGVTGTIGKTRASAALEWLHLGLEQPADDELAALTRDRKLVLPGGGGLAYYVFPYKGARLHVRYAAPRGSEGCGLTVRLDAQGLARPLEPALQPNAVAVAPGQLETLVDLTPVSERVARLELLARGAGCRQISLTEATIVMPGPAPQLRRGKPPRNVIFWMIDNVRADRYSAYNPSTRVKTPVIDELGKQGTVFGAAYIQGTESRVSHASIWTGLYPKQHRFIDPKAKLSLAWDTLPEEARKAKLFTAAWIANGFVSKFWGFGEGWDLFRNTLHQGGGLTAEALAGHALQFIEERGKETPFYIYVGTIDPHVSWRGREPWLSEYHPEPYDGPYKKNVMGKDVEKMATGARQTSPAERKRIIAIYDSTVSYNDHHLGRIVKLLKDMGIFNETMIVITADHGEELWDFGRIGHGHSARHPVVAVPLIIHYPPIFGSGVSVREGVDVLSVMPSILDALGAPIPSTVQGESLLPLAQGVGRGYPRPSLATQYEFGHTIRLEQWKLWVAGKGVPQLYDLDSKEGELRDVGEARPMELRWLTDALSTFLHYQNRWRSSRWGVASNHRAVLANDLETGTGPGPIRPGS